MDPLASYRRLQIEVQCPTMPEPLHWLYSTTKSDAEVLKHALRVAAVACEDKSAEHQATHVAEIVADLTDQEGAVRA